MFMFEGQFDGLEFLVEQAERLAMVRCLTLPSWRKDWRRRTRR